MLAFKMVWVKVQNRNPEDQHVVMETLLLSHVSAIVIQLDGNVWGTTTTHLRNWAKGSYLVRFAYFVMISANFQKNAVAYPLCYAGREHE